jgi:hypothetical protein
MHSGEQARAKKIQSYCSWSWDLVDLLLSRSQCLMECQIIHFGQAEEHHAALIQLFLISEGRNAIILVM